MRKLLASLFCAMIAVTFVACGEQKPAAPAKTPAPAAGGAEKKAETPAAPAAPAAPAEEKK